MPVFNQENYLSEAIESVLNQSLKNFEFLLLDDGSTDSSAQIIGYYATVDNRIKAFYGPNHGKCEATNMLASLAQGFFLAFMDADDVMMPDRLETQIEFHLKNPKVDATSSHCYYINEKSKGLGQQNYPGLQTIEECNKIRENKIIIQCSFTALMTTKSAFLTLKGLSADKWPCEDFDFFNRLIDHGYSLVIIQTPLMKYRLHASAITEQNPLAVFEKIGWVFKCIELRRKNEAEIPFESYKMLRDADSTWKKLNRKRFEYSQIYFRRAGISMLSKKYFDFTIQLITASLLSPSHITLKVIRLLKPHLP